MPRHDPIWAKIDVEIFMGESFNGLTPAQKYVYWGLWILAVKYRTDVFLVDLHRPSFLAHVLQLSPQLFASSVRAICKLGLAEKNLHGDLMIKGVKDCHKKLTWDKSPEVYLKRTQDVPEMISKRGESQRD